MKSSYYSAVLDGYAKVFRTTKKRVARSELAWEPLLESLSLSDDDSMPAGVVALLTYEDGYWIAELENERYWLLISREEWLTPDDGTLEQLERHLADFALGEEESIFED